MKKIKILVLSIIAVLAVGYFAIALPTPKSHATDQGAWNYDCFGTKSLFSGHGYEVAPDGSWQNESKNWCTNGTVQNLPSFQTVLALTLNNSSDPNNYYVDYTWADWFCPAGNIAYPSKCLEQNVTDQGSGIELNKTNGTVNLFSRQTSPASYKAQNGLPYGGACGTYQNDISFVIHKGSPTGSVECSYGDMSSPGVSSQAWWAECNAGVSCSNPLPSPTYGLTPSPSPTYGVTPSPSPTYGVTPTPTTPPHLIVIKHVINNNGGTKNAWDFTMYVRNALTGQILYQFPGTEKGKDVQLPSGISYIVYEGNHDGYDATSVGQCAGSVADGQIAYCTIVNDDIPSITPTVTPPPPTLIVYKFVNPADGPDQPGDFTIHVTGTNVSVPSFPGSANGVAVTLDPGQYAVTEDPFDGYTLTGRSTDCSGYIATGQTKTCVMVNTENGVTPSPTIIIPSPTIINNNGCGSDQSNNNGGNNNSNCNNQNQNQNQNQYNNNNQTVNITYAQPQQQVLGVSYPAYANALPNTGPGDSLALLGALTPLGFILRKVSKK